MQCPRCHEENRQTARFCGACGLALSVSCTACGTQLVAGSKFCDNCGGAVPGVSGEEDAIHGPVAPQPAPRRSYIGSLSDQGVLEHERKQVTVLFADIKGSTELVADRDPDDANRLLNPILEQMMEAVRLYEGTVNQVLGDGIMALFGAPIAYEDHAVRACYSALKMQESIRKSAEAVRRTEGFPLQIRIGLNSGEVAARAVGGDLPLSYSVKGQTVHLAARMEQLAIPGTILMTAQTLRFTEGYVVTKALGPMTVKGLAAPIEAYELLGASALRSRLQVAAAHGLTPFVGRIREISVLRRARDTAWTGHGQVVGIVGEPGVGKSRLIHEFTRSERTSGWLILEAGAASYGAAASYVPVTEFLKAYFQIALSDPPAVVRDKVTSKILGLDERLLTTLPTLLTLLDLPQEEPHVESVASSQRRRSALEAVKRLLFRESEARPLMLILEDLHTVDPDTQALIDGLVDSLPSAHILLVVSYRPEYRHRWGGKTYYTQIRADPLTDASASEMLTSLLGNDSAVGALIQLLLEKTAGNPLFLEESVRALVESGALSGARGAYSVTRPVSEFSVPDTVEALLASRIDRLGHTEKRLIQCGAVIGHRVPFRVLQGVARLSGEELKQSLEHLQNAELLYETRLFPDLEYTFKHALIRDVAYHSLTAERRRVLHTAAFAAGEQLDPDQTLERAEWLAFHAFRAQLWDRAVKYYRSAAARAIARAANRLAVQHLENALIAADHLAAEERTALAVDLRIDLRHALTPLGQIQRTLDHLRTAEALATQSGDRARLGRIIAFTANCLFLQARYEEALTTGTRALAIARELQDPALEVATRMYMGRAKLSRGECRAAIEMFEEIIAALNARPADEFLGLPVLPAAFARSNLAACLAEVGDFAEAAAHAAEASRRAAPSGQADSILWANWSVGLVAMLRGHAEDAVVVFEQLYEFCRTHDFDAYVSRILAALGCSKCRMGLVDVGLQLLAQAVAIDGSREPKIARSFALSARAEALFLAGDFESALTAANEALQFTRDHQERGAEAHACLILGAIHTRHESAFDAAHAALHNALAIATDLDLQPLVAHCELALGELYTQRNDPTQARDSTERGRLRLAALGMKQWFRLDPGAASGLRTAPAS